MKKIAIALLAGWTLVQVQAAELPWLTDLPKAQAQAKSENKMVLLDFTGLPRFEAIKTEHITPAVELLLSENRARIEGLTRSATPVAPKELESAL